MSSGVSPASLAVGIFVMFPYIYLMFTVRTGRSNLESLLNL